MKYEAKNYQITIAFLNDWYDNVTMYDRNVFFKSDIKTDIKGPMSNAKVNVEAGNCGSDCYFVRDDIFAWNGAYLISFGKFLFWYSSFIVD